VAEYIDNLVDVFKAIPLEPWGSIWVNIGDKRGKQGELLGIPERFCIAMNDAGFYRIDNAIWAKESVRIDGTSVGQAMIEPAKRRLNGNGHEPFYRFVLDPRQAWSDTCAVRIPRRNVGDIRYLPDTLMRCHTSLEGRNLTNVWNIPMGQTKEDLQHNLGVKGQWKTPLRGKVQRRDFSTALGNPTTAAGFPLFPPPRLRRVNFPIPPRQEEKRKRREEE
jgi:hypothetical protein